METINPYDRVPAYNDYKLDVKRDKQINQLLLRVKKLERRCNFLSVINLIMILGIAASSIYLIERLGIL